MPSTPLLIGTAEALDRNEFAALERIIVIGRQQCLVASHSNPGSWHTVEYDKGQWHCTCISGSVRKSCRHITAVRDWFLYKLDARLDVGDAA